MKKLYSKEKSTSPTKTTITVQQKQQSHNQRFVPQYEINHKLKDGEWRSLFPEGVDISISDFIGIIQDAYGIEDDVTQSLVFTYDSLSVSKQGNLNHKFMKLCPNTKDGPLFKGRCKRYKKKMEKWVRGS